MKKIVQAAFAIVVLLAASLPLSAVASARPDIMPAYSVSGLAATDYTVIAPEQSYDVLSFPTLTVGETCKCTGKVAESYVIQDADVTYYCADIDEHNFLLQVNSSVTFNLDLSASEVDASDYGVLKFGMAVRGERATARGFFLRIDITTDDGVSTANTYVEGAEQTELSLVATDISSLEGVIRSVRVTLYFTNSKKPESVLISSPYLVREDEFEGSSRYCSADLGAVRGEFDRSSGTITTDDGDCVIRGTYAGEFVGFNGKAYFVVSISGAESGHMSLGVKYYDSISGRVVEAALPRISLIAGTTQYAFPIAIDGSVMGYSITLQSTETSGGLTLDGVQLVGGADEIIVEDLGSVTGITRIENTVRFEGTINREVAKEFAGARIGFFALSSDYRRDGVLIDSIAITTKFEYTLSLEGQPISPDTSMYMAAIVTDDGGIMPISRPRYGDTDDFTVRDSAKLGFTETPVVSAFEANASHIVIDVPLDEILNADGKAVTAVSYIAYGIGDGERDYSARSVDLNRKKTEEIEQQIDFCVSAGMNVYLRFVSKTPIEGLTYVGDGADNYAICTSDLESKYLYCAIVKYFASRSEGIAGFVLGTDSTDPAAIGEDVFADGYLGGYIKSLADVCRLTYNSASAYIDSPVIIVPFSCGGAMSQSSFGVMLADAIDTAGAMPFVFMYVTDGLGSNDLADVMKNIREMGCGDGVSAMLSCRISESELAADYALSSYEQEAMSFPEYVSFRIVNYCANQRTADAVLISIDGSELSGARDVYSSLKRTGGGGVVVEASAGESVGQAGTLCDMWDFTDKYYTLGWRAVGVSRLSSDTSRYGDRTKRCLSSALEPSSTGSAGILLCNFEYEADMTPADSMEVVLSLYSPNEETVELVFILGTKDDRAEYSMSVSADGSRRTYTCDLTKYELRTAVDYMGVMVYSRGGADLEIERISLSSRTAGCDELKSIFDPPLVAEEEGESNITAVFVVVALVFVLTSAIFGLILRRDREAADMKGTMRTDGLRSSDRERIR